MKSELEAFLPELDWKKGDHDGHFVGENAHCRIEIDKREDGDYVVEFDLARCGKEAGEMASFSLFAISREDAPSDVLVDLFDRVDEKREAIGKATAAIKPATKET